MTGLMTRVTALCVAAAMLSALLRTQRPELAMALSLAVGVGVLSMLAVELPPTLKRLEALTRLVESGTVSSMARAAGVAVVAELGAQLCLDAGERALAGRIALAARVALLVICAPMLAEALECAARLLS